MSFSYLKDEDRFLSLVFGGNVWNLEERGQHFLWAFLVSEAAAQVRKHMVARAERIQEGAQTAELYWRAETHEERAAAQQAKSIVIRRVSLWHFAVEFYVGEFPNEERKAVEFAMSELTGEVSMRCFGVSVPTFFRDVRSIDDARRLAAERIAATVAALAPFEPKFPGLGIV